MIFLRATVIVKMSFFLSTWILREIYRLLNGDCDQIVNGHILIASSLCAQSPGRQQWKNKINDQIFILVFIIQLHVKMRQVWFTHIYVQLHAKIKIKRCGPPPSTLSAKQYTWACSTNLRSDRELIEQFVLLTWGRLHAFSHLLILSNLLGKERKGRDFRTLRLLRQLKIIPNKAYK